MAFVSNYQYNTTGNWSDWSPSFTNFVRGAGTLVAKKCQIGKVVHIYLEVVLGTGFNFTGGSSRFGGFPLMKNARDGCCWRGQIIQASTQIGYPLWGYSNTNNLILIRHEQIAGSNVFTTIFTATTPITFVVGDIFVFTAMYEVD